ncbi:MAG: hypothetical protein KDD32_04305 [Bacteroidetes bacterium]|nr:hypothetical protein [Bacteroidota bacterium]
MMNRLLTFLCLWLMGQQVSAQSYEFNEHCLKAYQQIFELRFAEAERTLAAEQSQNPQNLVPTFLENYIDFLALFISEEDAMFQEREGNKDKRLDILKSGDKDSPYYLYTQAEIYMQWAFTRVKFGEYIKAFLEIKKAYKLLNENAEKFPDFKPNLKSLGVLHTLLGAIPDKYKFGAKVFGMKGSIPQGMGELAQAIKDENFIFKDEALIMYAMLQLHLNKNEKEAWKIINTNALQPDKNLTHCFAASSIAMYTGKNDQAIKLLENRPKGPQYFPFPYLDFYLGSAKLNRLDNDADIYLKKYVTQYKGKNFIKEAHRKLSWFYLLKGNSSSYNYHVQMTVLEGEAVTDEDKSALAEVKSGIKPNKQLLEARLLFDGAYYSKALKIIEGMDEAKLTNEMEKVEYSYRKARILHEMNELELAKQAYLRTIERGGSLDAYFAPNSCIKLGNIYEKEKNMSKAEEYYKKAFTYGDHEYKNSIDAEAKAGLNRLK